MRDTYHAQRSWQAKETKAQTDLESNIEWFVSQGRIEGQRTKRDMVGLTNDQIDTVQFTGFNAAYIKHQIHVRNGHALSMNEAQARDAFDAGWGEAFYGD